MEIHIKGLIKQYGEKLVLDIDELKIEKGKITAITGPNGSGKSTLLNIMSGIDKEFKGEVKYQGKLLDNEILKDITYIFQSPYLFQRTVYDNIMFPLKLRNRDIPQSKTLVDRIIKDLEIEDLRYKRANLLSGGESQKVALARGIIFSPKVLLLDEPTSNIDPDSIKVMERQIIKFNQETNGTVIIVTHNMEQAQRLSDRIINILDGKVVL